jgi:3-hydroxyacyl-CoA dehydrogenase
MVNYEVRGAVAVLSLNNPPVNSLGQALRQSLKEGLDQALADSNVQAIVIASTGKIFCGGADISEFGSPKAFAAPSLNDVCNAIEAASKPVIAAINGQALGGGCEVALSADYRFAEANAKLGLPEVHLGILPGAGGTQRLPRLAGVETALHMIFTGTPVGARTLLQTGVIDQVFEGPGDFLAAAVAYAQELIAAKAPVKTCAEIEVDTSKLSPTFFADFRAANQRALRGFYSPERCIQALEAACALPLAEGLKKEGELFLACMNTPQARAQQHLFFAERAARKIPGISPKMANREIRKVAIIGSGTMGGGIAMNFINAGIPTVMLDLNAEALQRGLGVIKTNYDISAKKGRFTPEQVEQILSRLSTTTSYDDIRDVDLVIEAVFERMDIKQTVFKTLDEVCKTGAILATNTSTLDVNAIAAATRRPQDVIGLHFFSPANVMRLLEIVRADKTADDVLMTTINIAAKIGKVPVVAGVCFGFIGNRMLEPYGREASRMMLEGATPAQIDQALTKFGMAMGPMSVQDLAGIDIGALIRNGRRDVIAHDPSYAIIQDKLYELGRYGQKTGRGNYIYEGREQKEDPEVMALCRKTADALGVAQRAISEQEIIERTIYFLVNEAAQILDQGIAYRSSDCDLVWVNGYGFPIWRGGPLQYADEIGLHTIVDALNRLKKELGAYGEMWFTPAPLLVKLAAAGKTFKDYVNPKFAE